MQIGLRRRDRPPLLLLLLLMPFLLDEASRIGARKGSQGGRLFEQRLASRHRRFRGRPSPSRALVEMERPSILRRAVERHGPSCSRRDALARTACHVLAVQLVERENALVIFLVNLLLTTPILFFILHFTHCIIWAL